MELGTHYVQKSRKESSLAIPETLLQCSINAAGACELTEDLGIRKIRSCMQPCTLQNLKPPLLYHLIIMQVSSLIIEMY